MKKKHEAKFRNAPVTIDENILQKLTNDLQAQLDGLLEISTDTNTTVHSVGQKVDQMMQQLAALSSVDNDKLYIAELDAIKKLRKQGKINTVIEMLLEYKKRNWSNLSPETKYKVVANLANCYLSLNKKKEYADVTRELENIPFETADSLSLRLLGFAVVGDYVGFDALFEKAILAANDNINLWVAYIERYKKIKTSQVILAEIPPSVAESGNVIFHIGLLSIEEGRKKEGIELLKKAVSKLDPAEERYSDSSSIIATYLMKDLVHPHKILFKTHTEEEKKDLEDARVLFTESWDHVKNTELATSKWGLLMNRGVVNKVTGRKDEALADFQKAYELSNEYLPYKNLLLTCMELGNFAAAEKLLETKTFATGLPQEEKEINETFKARLFILQGKFIDAITLLSSLLKREPGDTRDLELYCVIVATCLQHNALDVAKPYVDEMIAAFPDDPNGYLFSGFIHLKSNKAKSLDDFDKAAELLTDSSPINYFSELASGYSDLGEYEKAIPNFERIVDLTVYNDFTRGLVYAVYQAGELEKALQLAEKLYSAHNTQPFLAEIIGNIYDETKRYDEAIRITQDFQERAKGSEKDFFSFRAAKIYSHKKDWENVRKMAILVQDVTRIPMNDIFILSFLLIKSGEKTKGMGIAYEARTKFFDDSEAHLKYISLSTGSGDKHEDLFPTEIGVDCAVSVRTEDGKEETYVITDKNSRGEKVLKPSDDFAVKLLGRNVGDELTLKKGYGIDYKVSITGIMTIYVHAFRESLRLFETRFAGMHGVVVARANPGQPDDQIEQVVRDSTLSGNEFQKQVYDIYNKRVATIGVLAGLFKRNVVKQWMALVTSPDVQIFSYSHNELSILEESIVEEKPVVLDITCLLTNFFFLPETILFAISNKEVYVSQSTIDELQEFHDELEIHVEGGMLSMGYQDGRMVAHSMTSEDVVKQRQKISDIIQWCTESAQIKVPADLIRIRRKDRQRTSELFGDCFYDSALLARELNAIIISDDDTFKNFLRSEYQVNSYSTFQLALWEAQKHQLSNDFFEQLTLNCILGNYIFLPVNTGILWKVFDLSGFQIRQPFTTAVKGLNIMVPPVLAAVISAFFKKLYLESGLAI
ncbi:MAG: tetratricopeptide repeat protein, partial [Candidatus Woesebacteria bacterium]